jgi:predicted metal-dependent enzyme (double-stranded beta helix superfamily)
MQHEMSPKLKPLTNYLSSLTSRADLKTLHRILYQSGITIEDVAQYLQFNDKHYSRNKVMGSKFFDLFVMCWKPGQASLVHDHTDSSCALKILTGAVTEICCELIDSTHRIVRPSRKVLYAAGKICSAQDNEIHQIVNASKDQNLVTLHIYSPPLKMSAYEYENTQHTILSV